MQCTSTQNYYSNGVFNSGRPPCGKCLSCVLNKRHQWASRLMLERKSHDCAQFITLTYEDEPEEARLKKDWQNFAKALRYADGRQPRYFSALEYGTKHGRAHFHAILFGRPTTYERRFATRSRSRSVITVDPVIEDAWSKGSTYVKACDSSTAATNITQYVAGYVLKNKWMPSASAPSEWALMSRKPYIGRPALSSMRDALLTKQGKYHCSVLGTVPDRFKMAGRHYKIPNRLRKDLCDMLGLELHPVPPSNGTIVVINGNKVRQELAPKILTIQEARAKEGAIASRIRRNRFKNATQETG